MEQYNVQKKMDQIPNVPDFSGKVLSITLTDDGASHDLVSPVFEMQGGRLFLVGRTPPGATTSDWTVDVPWAVAWDRVTDYFVFDSLEQYSAAIQKCRDDDDEGDEPTEQAAAADAD